jgi:hypothetical protein
MDIQSTDYNQNLGKVLLTALEVDFDKINEVRRLTEKAKKEAKEAAINAMKRDLEALVKNAQMIGAMKYVYTGSSWNGLMGAYTAGKSLMQRDGVSLEALRRAVSDMVAAFAGLTTVDHTPDRRDDEDDELHQGLPLILDVGGGTAVKPVASPMAVMDVSV